MTNIRVRSKSSLRDDQEEKARGALLYDLEIDPQGND